MPATFRLREAANHRLLTHMSFDFQPGAAANSFPIAAVRFFDDDPLEALLFHGPEESYAFLGKMLAQADVRQAFDQLGENFLTAQQRQLFQGMAVEVKQIKNHVDERSPAFGI